MTSKIVPGPVPLSGLMLFFLAWWPAWSEAAPRPAGKEDLQFQKPVKMLIGAIRYNKNDLALKMLAIDEMTRELNAGHLAKMSTAQQKEFAAGLAALIRRLSFPRAREMFEHIDAILYDPSQVQGSRARIRSTIVVHRSYKKQEIVITWTLIKSPGKGREWLILDTAVAGESTLEGIRDEQVNPLVAEGGVPLLMQKLRAKLAEVK